MHQAAKMLELGHRSVGSEEERVAVVFKKTAGAESGSKAMEGAQKVSLSGSGGARETM